jgi:dynein heavy chain 1, cytosolic
MSQMRDVAPIAGVIIWARQIENQLLTYMKHFEDVRGNGWELC